MSAKRRSARREAVRVHVACLLIGFALAGAVVAVVTGERKWLGSLLLIPLAAMLVSWAEDCPTCGGRLRPAVLDSQGREVCVRCRGRSR